MERANAHVEKSPRNRCTQVPPPLTVVNPSTPPTLPMPSMPSDPDQSLATSSSFQIVPTILSVDVEIVESSSPLPSPRMPPQLPPSVQNSAPSSPLSHVLPPVVPSEQLLSSKVLLPPSPPTQSSVPSSSSEDPLGVMSAVESYAVFSSQVPPSSNPLAQSSILTLSSSSVPPAIPPVESSITLLSSQVPPPSPPPEPSIPLVVEPSTPLPSPPLAVQSPAPSPSLVEPLASPSSSTQPPPPPEPVQSVAPLSSSPPHATQRVQSLGPSSASPMPPQSSPQADTTPTKRSPTFQKQFARLLDQNEKPQPSAQPSSIKLFNKIIYRVPQAPRLQMLPPPESSIRLTLSNFKLNSDSIKPVVSKPVPSYPPPYSSSRAQIPLSSLTLIKSLEPPPQAPHRKYIEQPPPPLEMKGQRLPLLRPPLSFGSSSARLGRPSWMSKACWMNLRKEGVNNLQQPLWTTPTATSSINNQTERGGGAGNIGSRKRSSPNENADGRDSKRPILISDDDDKDEIFSRVMKKPERPPYPKDLRAVIERSKQRTLQLQKELSCFDLNTRGRPPKSKPSEAQSGPSSASQAYTDRTTVLPAVSLQQQKNMPVASFTTSLTHTPPPSSNETQTEPRSETGTSKECVLPTMTGLPMFPIVPLTELHKRKYDDIRSAICYESFSSDDLAWMPPSWWVEERICTVSGRTDLLYHDETGLVFRTKAAAMRYIKEMGLDAGPSDEQMGRRHKITRFF